MGEMKGKQPKMSLSKGGTMTDSIQELWHDSNPSNRSWISLSLLSNGLIHIKMGIGGQEASFNIANQDFQDMADQACFEEEG
jgi:hypothetical protein